MVNYSKLYYQYSDMIKTLPLEVLFKIFEFTMTKKWKMKKQPYMYQSEAPGE